MYQRLESIEASRATDHYHYFNKCFRQAVPSMCISMSCIYMGISYDRRNSTMQ